MMKKKKFKINNQTTTNMLSFNKTPIDVSIYLHLTDMLSNLMKKTSLIDKSKKNSIIIIYKDNDINLYPFFKDMSNIFTNGLLLRKVTPEMFSYPSPTEERKLFLVVDKAHTVYTHRLGYKRACRILEQWDMLSSCRDDVSLILCSNVSNFEQMLFQSSPSFNKQHPYFLSYPSLRQNLFTSFSTSAV